jgi:predicted transcriptional regulator
MTGKPTQPRYVWKDAWRHLDRNDWRRLGLRQIDKHVLHVLFEHMGAGDDPHCWPEQETIGDEMAVRRDTVARSTERLELAGWIRREKRGHADDDGWHYVYWATIPERLQEQVAARDVDGTGMSPEQAKSHSEPDMSTRPARHVGGDDTNHPENHSLVETYRPSDLGTALQDPAEMVASEGTPEDAPDCPGCGQRTSGPLGWCTSCKRFASDPDGEAA